MIDPTYSIISFPGPNLPEQYRPMVLSKWLRSLRYGNPTIRKIDPPEYYDKYKKFIEMLLNKPGSIVRLAVLSEEHDVVLGFSVNREDVLDFLHVQRDFRKTGIATKLIPEGITTFSHLTLTWVKIWRSNAKYREWKFNPFA